MKLNRGVMLIVTLVLGTVTGYTFTHLLSYFPSVNQVAPAALLAVVTAPVVYLWQCLSKMTELQKLSGINKSEFRRLEPKIKASKAFYSFKIVFIVVCNVTLGVLFFLAPTGLQVFEIPIIKLSVASLGFMTIFGLISALECYSETHTIQQFEAKIAKRESDRKLVTETLAKLSPKQAK